MKVLKTEREFEKAIHCGNYPILTIDIGNCSRNGIEGCKFRVEDSKFYSDGKKHYNNCQLKIFWQFKRLDAVQGTRRLKDYDEDPRSFKRWMYDIEYSVAPIVKAGETVVVIVTDEEKDKIIKVMMVETKAVEDRASRSAMIEFEDVDMTFVINAINKRKGE